MSQHPFTIPNQLAPAARADINDALKALASTNSGATAPATTYANQFWYDTSTDLLKIRNEANSAWITLGAVDQTTGKFDPNLTIATNAEAIGGTENTRLMTALRVREATDNRLNVVGTAPLYACRAWANFNGPNVLIRGSGNLTGSRVNPGHYVFLFNVEMPDTGYAVNVTAGGAGAIASGNAFVAWAHNLTTLGFQVSVSDNNTDYNVDPTWGMITVFR